MSYGPVKARAEMLRELLAKQQPPIEAELEAVDADSTVAVVDGSGNFLFESQYRMMNPEGAVTRIRENMVKTLQ